jgi:hypothetical protein
MSKSKTPPSSTPAADLFAAFPTNNEQDEQSAGTQAAQPPRRRRLSLSERERKRSRAWKRFDAMGD